MKRIFCLILSALFATALNAQDRIHTTTGEVIDCKILEHENEDGRVIYLEKGSETDTRQFILPASVDYLEVGGERYVRNMRGYYSRLSMQFSRAWPEHRNLYGVTGYYGTNFWGLTATYTRCFTPQSALTIEVIFNNRGKWERGNKFESRGYGLVPHYEFRNYLPSMKSFLYMQIGAGACYYSCSYSGGDPGWILDKGTHLIAIATSLKVGLDVKLRTGVYLTLAGRYYWEPYGIENGEGSGLAHSDFAGGSSIGLQVGLRFGSGQ